MGNSQGLHIVKKQLSNNNFLISRTNLYLVPHSEQYPSGSRVIHTKMHLSPHSHMYP